MVSSGSSTRRSVALGAPGCLPCGLPERLRTERLAAGFLVNGESDDGGLPLVEESRPSWACSAASKPSSSVTRAARAAISASLLASNDTTSPCAASRPDSIIGTVVDHRCRTPSTRHSLRLNSYAEFTGGETERSDERARVTTGSAAAAEWLIDPFILADGLPGAEVTDSAHSAVDLDEAGTPVRPGPDFATLFP